MITKTGYSHFPFFTNKGQQCIAMRMVIIAVAVHGEDDDDAYQVPINQSSRPVPEALVKRAIA